MDNDTATTAKNNATVNISIAAREAIITQMMGNMLDLITLLGLKNEEQTLLAKKQIKKLAYDTLYKLNLQFLSAAHFQTSRIDQIDNKNQEK